MKLRHRLRKKEVKLPSGLNALSWETYCGVDPAENAAASTWCKVNCPECKKLKPLKEKRSA